jgi:hypothetical protein
VRTDAIGGILQQWQGTDKDQKLMVISYGSRKLTALERTFLAARQEMLAAMTFIEYFKDHLIKRKFTLRCDTKKLRWPQAFREERGETAYWLQKLERFDFQIAHKRWDEHEIIKLYRREIAQTR